jgi:hypothetical protein
VIERDTKTSHHKKQTPLAPPLLSPPLLGGWVPSFPYEKFILFVHFMNGITFFLFIVLAIHAKGL